MKTLDHPKPSTLSSFPNDLIDVRLVFPCGLNTGVDMWIRDVT